MTEPAAEHRAAEHRAAEHRDDNTTFPADPTPPRNLREDADDSASATSSDTVQEELRADDDTDLLPHDLDQAKKLRSENRNLRERLHTAETEREAAITRLAAADRREVERIAAQHLIDPKDLWTAQPDTSAFLDDEFQDIVGDKVIAAAKEIIAAKPHLAKPASAPPPSNRPIEGLRGGASPEVKPTTPSWASAIHGTGR